MPNHNPDEDEEFYDENLEVEINNVLANEQLLDLQQIQQSLTPKNIVDQIRNMVEGPNMQEVMKKSSRCARLTPITGKHPKKPANGNGASANTNVSARDNGCESDNTSAAAVLIDGNSSTDYLAPALSSCFLISTDRRRLKCPVPERP